MNPPETNPIPEGNEQGLLPLEQAHLAGRLPEDARSKCQSLLEELLRHAVLETAQPKPTPPSHER